MENRKQARDVAAGVVLLNGVPWILTVFHACYGLFIVLYGESLWALQTYGPALSVPGGVVSWGVTSVLAAGLLVIGVSVRREKVVGVGATLSALWLTFFSLMFGIASVNAGPDRKSVV